MRVVMVANWWYRRGGLGRVMFLEAESLAAAGHEVIGFAAAHSENLPSTASRYFPRFVETASGGVGMSPLTRLKAAGEIIHNRDAARRFAALLDDVKPDLIHVHNTVRQLSPSILGAASRRGIPVVMTAHDFSLVCPQGLMLKGGDRACEPPNCLGGNVLRSLQYRCVKGSLAVSGLAAVESLTHRTVGAYVGRLHSIIVPSRFLAEQLRAGGVPARMLRHLPNGLPDDPTPDPLPRRGGQVLYLGRLAPEKGLEVLLAAAGRLSGASFCIAGDGPSADALRALAPPNVRFTGHLDEPGLRVELSRAVVVVSPSVCHDNAPVAMLEAMRAGRAVVATDLGGQPELLGGTGVIVPAGDSEVLTRALDDLLHDPAKIRLLGAAGRNRFVAQFTLRRHMDGLVAIYRRAVSGLDANGVGSSK